MKMNVILIVVGSVLLAVGVFRSIAERKREAQNVVRFEKPSQKPFVYNIDMDSLNHAGDAPKDESPFPEPEPTQKEKPEPADISPDNPQAQVETGKVEETTGPKQKGNLFEGHVADILKANGIRLKQWNQGTTSPEGAFAENELNPDFFVSQKSDRGQLDYWIECKYRASLHREGFRLKDYQLSRYESIQRSSKRKIIVALGVGGAPDSPEKFYLIPLDTLSRQHKERAKSLRFSSFFIFIPPRNVKNCNFDTNLIQLSRNAWFIKIHNRIKNRYENYHWVSRVYVIEC